MKKVKILMLLPLIFLMFSCEKDTITNKLVEPTEPVFRSDQPLFPATSIHIIQREFANLSNRLDKRTSANTLAEYTEERLLELYPEVAYEGMMKKSIEEIDKYKEEYSQYLTNLNDYYLSIGADSLLVEESDYREFTSLEDEIEFMAMTEEEIEEFQRFEALANSDNLVKREVLDDLMYSMSSNQNSSEIKERSGVLLVSALVSAAASYTTCRIIQSRNRAENKTLEFYEYNKDAGQKGDAFRHIYVSVLLRRYITRVGASIVLAGYEVVNPNEFARDTYMDYHNNKVGLFKYRFNKHLTFNFKLAQTVYFDETPIRSGSVKGDRITDFKVLNKYVL